MSKINNLEGKRFGFLTAVSLAGKNKHHKSVWLCVCDCGACAYVTGCNLSSGNTQSCGCKRKEVSKNLNLSHGSSKTRLFRTWANIKSRCLNQNNKSFKRYGGRGICICEEWKDFSKFEKWSLENGYKETLTIDRIDNNGNYTPNNCRWVDLKCQARNRSNNHTICGKTIAQWAEETGINRGTILSRIEAGWSEFDATHKPAQKQNKQSK